MPVREEISVGVGQLHNLLQFLCESEHWFVINNVGLCVNNLSCTIINLDSSLDNFKLTNLLLSGLYNARMAVT